MSVAGAVILLASLSVGAQYRFSESPKALFEGKAADEEPEASDDRSEEGLDEDELEQGEPSEPDEVDPDRERGSPEERFEERKGEYQEARLVAPFSLSPLNSTAL